MPEQNIWIIRAMLTLIGSFFTLLAAFFTFFAVLQNEKHETTIEWFRKKWESMKRSRWYQMPEKIIRFVMEVKKSIIANLLDFMSDPLVNTSVRLGGIFMFGKGIWFKFGALYFKLSLLLIIPFSIIMAADLLQSHWPNKESRLVYQAKKIYSFLPESVVILSMVVVGLVTPVIWILLVVEVELLQAIIYMLAILPSFFLFSLPFIFLSGFFDTALSEDNINDLFLSGLAIGFSFSVTLFALFLGSLTSPTSLVPRSFQFLASNVIFDGITIWFTLKILRWALKRKHLLRIPLAILIGIVVAAVCACASLYFGLLGDFRGPSLNDIIFIFFGKVPNGKDFDLTPYFWAMHTTFIPTLIYLSILLVSWIGKMMLIPVEWFFGKGQEHKNPLALTAALFSLLALATAFVLSGFTLC